MTDLVEDIAKRLKTAADGYWNEFGAAPNRTPWEALSPHAQEEYLAMAREVVRCMEWARRLSAGELDGGGCSVAIGVARDAITHLLDKKHDYDPVECEGCEFSDDARFRIKAINGMDGHIPLTLPDEGWKP
jgi:hypothetical protein